MLENTPLDITALLLMWACGVSMGPVYVVQYIWAEFVRTPLGWVIPFLLPAALILWAIAGPVAVWPWLVWKAAWTYGGEPGIWFCIFMVVSVIMGFKYGTDRFFKIGFAIDKKLGIKTYNTIHCIYLILASVGTALLARDAYRAVTRKD